MSQWQVDELARARAQRDKARDDYDRVVAALKAQLRAAGGRMPDTRERYLADLDTEALLTNLGEIPDNG